MSQAYSKVKSVAKVVQTRGPELSEKVLKTMKIIADAVGATLGPGGMPVLIERQEYGLPALITKDGVTVFRSLGFQDPIEHSVMETARDAAVRTVTEAGDGPQPLWSRVLTPTGFVRMGDLKVGMDICGTDGTTQKVVGVYPKGKKELVRVMFEGGKVVECCPDHLWSVTTLRGKNKTLTTKELEQDFRSLDSGGHWVHKYYTPKTYAEFENATPLPLDPYLLGVLISDGSLCDSGSVEISLGKNKEHVIEKLILPDGLFLKKSYVESRNCFRVKIQGKTPSGKNIRNFLEDLGLRNTNSYTKSIPKLYLLNSAHVRTRLLQGLLDTDGYINARGLFEFSTVGEQLADDFLFLVRSLGKNVHRRIHTRERDAGSYSTRPIYRFQELKGNRFGEKIVGIERTGEHVEMQCIKVSNSNHLYITDDFVVTHNTSTCSVLAEAVVRYAAEYVAHNPRLSSQKVVRALESSFRDTIEPLIRSLAIKPDKRILHSVAKISANGDRELADAVMECFDLVGDEGNVTINELSGPSSYRVEKIEGFPIPIGFEESCLRFMMEFVNDQGNQRVFLEKPSFVLYHGAITDVTQLFGFMLQVAEFWQGRNPTEPGKRISQNVVLVATGFSESVLAWLALNFKQSDTLNVVPVVAPKSMQLNGEFYFLQDLAAVTGATIIDPLNMPFDQAELGALGYADSFEMTRFRSNVIGRNDPDEILDRAEQLQGQVNRAESQLDRMILQDRIGKLTGGIAKLIVVGASNGELKEKRDRAEDAVCAVRGAIKHGALPGGGWTLLRVATELMRGDNEIAKAVLCKALMVPVERILQNIGMHDEEITGVITKIVDGISKDTRLIYDAMEDRYVDAIEAGVLDSTPAVLEAVRNSISIASLLGTLGGVVVYQRDTELERREAQENNAFTRDASLGVNEANERF